MHISTVDYSLEKQASNSFAYLYNELNEKKIPIQELKIQLIERKTLRRL
jgi:DNA-binding LacI/PurR family transcriptional regulator